MIFDIVMPKMDGPELGAIINLDDITHIDYLDQEVGLPELVCVRYNPGPLRKGNAIIGQPEFANMRSSLLRKEDIIVGR